MSCNKSYHVTCDETLKDEKLHDTMDKYNRSVFWMAVTFVVLKTGPIYLVLVGVTASRLSDENHCL